MLQHNITLSQIKKEIRRRDKIIERQIRKNEKHRILILEKA
jgi:hypothetical protein